MAVTVVPRPFHPRDISESAARWAVSDVPRTTDGDRGKRS